MTLTDEDLREAASHRGLKLVKSRKRKPGVGDYGLFGLTDGSGRPLFGIEEDTLTATAGQIADFLRKGEASTWAASAKSTPVRLTPTPSGEPSTAKTADDAPSPIRQRHDRSPPITTEPNSRQRERPAAPNVAEEPSAETPRARTSSASEPKPLQEPEPRSEPEPELAIRAARPGDADAVHKWLASIGVEIGISAIKRAIAAATTRKETMLVGDRGRIVGCLAWHIVPTIQWGGIARITMILVDENERRSGVGRALYEEALSQFRTLKVHSVEVMSDIEIRNANGFYRALGLKQVSYRFALEI